MSKKTIYAADLFCGGGGTSQGLFQACEKAGLGVELLAINHWEVAVETHAKNHPTANHLCASLDSVDPYKVVPRGKLDLLVASPECTGHSIARGGKPTSDQQRASGWHVLRWAEHLRVENILVENVGEWLQWGPLGTNGKPLKSRRGETFRAWIKALESLGYNVSWRILNCADYGDATTRRRLFIIASRKHKGQNPWPVQTHAKPGSIFAQTMKHWRPAREIIDWGIPGESIFSRRRPLADTTLRRIEEGLRRFSGKAAEPFLALLTHGGRLRSVDEPTPTITGANRGELALVEPFLLGHRQHDESVIDPVDIPMRTITAHNGRDVHLVEPFVLKTSHKGGNGSYVRNVDDPLYTVTSAPSELGVVEPFMVPFYGERKTQDPRTHSVQDPMPTIPADPKFGLVDPFIVTYHGASKSRPVTSPLGTMTARDRFGLVEPRALDIRFRMLQPHELAAATGFPKDYKFAGNKGDRVKLVGNAVPVNTAEALCSALIA